MSEKITNCMNAWREWGVAERATAVIREGLMVAEEKRSARWRDYTALTDELSMEEQTELLALQAAEFGEDSK